MEIKKALKKIFHVLICIVLAVALVLTADTLYKNSTGAYTGFLGIGSGVVVSGSMVPTLNIDDYIFTVKLGKDSYSVGDIVTYQRDDDIIIHRIVDVGDDYVITKGDANELCDIPVKKDQILGKTFLVLKGAGNLFDNIRKNSVMWWIVFGFIIFVGGYITLSVFKWRRNVKSISTDKQTQDAVSNFFEL